MSKDLQQKLKAHWDSFTASEQKIASYLLQNVRDVPFETAASLSKRVGVSQMTVGRFLRNLGYEGLNDLKEELRGDASWRNFYRDAAPVKDADAITDHLHAEVRALTSIHALTGSKEWNGVVKMLATADRVTVSSFAQGTFLGLGLATMLQQARPNVSFNSGLDGAYVDMLLDSTRRSCIVLIDMRRYFQKFRAIAEEVVKRGIPLIIITDTDCYWARELTPHVLMAQADRAWHNFSTYMSLFSLLMTSMIRERGDVMERLGEVNELRERLVGYMGTVSSKGRGDTAVVKKTAGTRTRKKSRGG